MTDYNAIMAAIEAELALVAPTRVITRTLRQFEDHPAAQMASGVFLLLPAGVLGYPHEYPPGDNGQFRVLIIGRGKLAEDATGPQIDAAEFAMFNELEALADEHYELPDLIASLTLLDNAQSGQLEAPFYWVASTWEVFTREE